MVRPCHPLRRWMLLDGPVLVTLFSSGKPNVAQGVRHHGDPE
jgi:hypothetical protein